MKIFDIPSGLREWAKEIRHEPPYATQSDDAAMLERAAEEIERLRQETNWDLRRRAPQAAAVAFAVDRVIEGGKFK